MDEILEQLRHRGMPLNPPAASAELDRLESELAVRLPDEVRSLYEDHAGNPYSQEWELRLLPPEEAGDATKWVLQDSVLFDEDDYLRPLFEREGFALYWADADGNYAGVFSDGVLKGHVFVVDHDEAWPEPAWATVRSFYRASLDAPPYSDRDDFWVRSFVRDYPRPVDGPDDPLEDGTATALFDLYEERTPPGVRAGMQALSLCSRRHLDRVRPMIDSSSRWLRETAESTLQRFDPGDVDLLIGQISSSDHNTQLGAFLALKRLGDDRGLRAAADHEIAYWCPILAGGSQQSALGRVKGLEQREGLVEDYIRAEWWIQIRLAHRRFDAPEIHSAANGMAPSEIEEAVGRLGLPELHIQPFGHMQTAAVKMLDESPLTLAVTLPLWWEPGRVLGVADVRMVHDEGGFRVAIDGVRHPRQTALNWRRDFELDEL